ncbi:MAG: hypothetical protein OJF49_001078 [Ktedonobacterales bacterium]|nr:MAG: hypothetical protein OJF49_001078 [Ktedonobacterales bacterium]
MLQELLTVVMRRDALGRQRDITGETRRRWTQAHRTPTPRGADCPHD